MAADATSAYAALGLEPGADAAAIEQAYRRLIKQHHPDREGGNAARAAEINRAYREIRAERHLKAPLELNDEWPVPRQERAWLVFALLLAAATLGLLASQTPFAPLAEFGPPGAAQAGAERGDVASTRRDTMDGPLSLAIIDAAAHDALRLSRAGDEMAMSRTSRACHHLLRTNPSLAQLDRCAAFDDAVVALQDRDPLRDRGPFSELAVTGRALSGATALSADSVAIDSRLDRIRLRVELALAPAIQARAPKSD